MGSKSSKLPFYDDIEIPNEKKNQISKCVEEMEKKHGELYERMAQNLQEHSTISSKVLWNVVKKSNVQNFGRFISVVTFFKYANANKNDTIMLYNIYRNVYMNKDLSLYVKKKTNSLFYVIMVFTPIFLSISPLIFFNPITLEIFKIFCKR